MNISTETAEVTPALRNDKRFRFTRLFKHNVSLTTGLILLIFLVLVAILGPLLTQHSPYETSPGDQYMAPSLAHLFGTDEFGRDIITRVIHAARLDLFIAVSVTALAFVVGSIVGSFAGFYGGWVDMVISRLVDVLLSFPAFILAMGVTAMLGNNLQNVIIALSVAYMPYFIRLTRAEMLKLRNAEFADAARCMGTSKVKIMLVHLLPNAIGPAVAQCTLTMGWAILDAAGLSFLGLGIQAPTAEWGVMIGNGVRDIFSGEWWTAFFPGIAVIVTVMTFNLIAIGVRQLKED
ncbi:ABC transporter permease [Peribacillus glennii]|uniref:ABC transporter permease n=1 Tax=Peribacillus glennii TaxID=2303991 RepID=A0A372LHR0_9BACI|nr:ABC transporter permease [Peribacillus glennii]RFU65146.1 ABC transporter permease [Peribacillus glennii]